MEAGELINSVCGIDSKCSSNVWLTDGFYLSLHNNEIWHRGISFSWDLLIITMKKCNITRFILENISFLHKLWKHRFIDQSTGCLSALQTTPAWLLLSHQTEKPSGHCARDGTNSSLLKRITDLGHVKTSFLSHDCFFLCLCLSSLCPCPRSQSGAYTVSVF